MKRSTVFISYRRRAGGEHFSLSLKNRLERDGYDCFRDQENLRQGDWRSQLFAEIDQRDYFILLLSEGAFDGRGDGDAFIEEITRAYEGGKTIVPYILKGFDTASIPEGLAWINQLEHIRQSDGSEGEFELAITKFEKRFARRTLGDRLHTARGRALGTAAVVVVVLCVACASYLLFSQQPPSSEDRPSYYEDEVESGLLGDKVVFNSIANNPNFGDERDFVGARLSSRRDLWSSGLSVVDGETYRIRMLVHNDNPNGKDSAAHGVRIAFDVPTDSDTEQVIEGTIYADDGEYGRYGDVAILSSDARFHLEYVDGSALWENNGIAGEDGLKLDDAIIGEQGVLVGFDALDGVMPGGYHYAGYASIEVRVVYDEYVNDASINVTGSGPWVESLHDAMGKLGNPGTHLEMELHARRAGSHEWVNTLNASVNDDVEYLIYYRNMSDALQEDVMIRDVLPDNVEYVSGSTKLFNSNYQSGVLLGNDTVTTSGINIGSYNPDANAYVTFKGKVVDNTLESNSVTQVENWASVTVDGTVVKDSADLYVSTEDFNVNVRVRQSEEAEWSQYLDVGRNAEVEFIVYIENISGSTVNGVRVSSSLHDALEYVDGSAALFSGSDNGTPLDLFGPNDVGIGSYAPGQSAYLTFKAKVNPSLLKDGRNKLGMSAFVSCGHFVKSWSCAVYAEC